MTNAFLSSRGVLHAVELNGLIFGVEYDADLPTRGITEFHPRHVIKLREWDSEVFLHECIHIAFAVAPGGAWWAPDFQGNKRINDDEQEVFVQHLSRFLDGVGFRMSQKRDSAP